MRQITTAQSFTNVDTRSLKDYLQDLSKYKLLTIEEEKEIGLAAKRGDTKAKQKLIESNLRFAITVAKHYQGRGLTLEDLIAEANAGVCIAAEKWDVDRGYRFITYALWWIRQCITKALTNKSRTIRLAQGPVEIQFRINKYKQEFIQKNMREPTDEELANLCKCSVSQLHNAINSNIGYTSLDMQTTTDPDAPLIIEAIPNNNIENTDDAITNLNRREVIIKVLNDSKIFTPLERDVTLDYYGITSESGEVEYFRILAMKYHKSTEGVRQARNRALIKMKKYYGKTLMSLY